MDDSLGKLITDLVSDREILFIENTILEYSGHQHLTKHQSDVIPKMLDTTKNHIFICARQIGISTLVNGFEYYTKGNDHYLFTDHSNIHRYRPPDTYGKTLIVDLLLYQSELVLNLMNRSERTILFVNSKPGIVHDLVNGTKYINNNKETVIHYLPNDVQEMRKYMPDIIYRRNYLCEIV